jgi:hypothetical protein
MELANRVLYPVAVLPGGIFYRLDPTSRVDHEPVQAEG